MNQEDGLVLLVVFVLGFVVSRMMSGRLVEGDIVGEGEVCYDESIGYCPGGKVGYCPPFDGYDPRVWTCPK